MSSPRFDFSAQARRCYDTLAILAPDVPLAGLYTDGANFFLVCTDVSARQVEGQSFKEWFESTQRPAGAPITVTDVAPAGAVEVQPRTIEEISIGKGHAATLDSLFVSLSLALPHDFPLVGLTNGIGTIHVLVARELTPAEGDQLVGALRDVGMAPPHQVVLRPDLMPGPSGEEALILQPARAFSHQTTSTLAALLEEDEEWWRRARVALLSGRDADASVEPPWKGSLRNNACLVTTAFEPGNLRRYLSFYSTVVLVAPIAESLDRALRALRITRKELTELVRSGHIRVLLPQGLSRYDRSWVEELADANSDALLFSRRLAAIGLADMRRRLPALFAPATAIERRGFLNFLAHALPGSPPSVRPFLETMLVGLPECWSRLEFLLNLSGAMAAMDGPLVHFASQLVRMISKKDVQIELGVVSASLEWAGALGADLCPAEADSYSESGAAKLLVALHSGFGGGGPPVAQAHELTLADNLVAVDNDAAILDFVREIGTSDRDRLRALVRGVGVRAHSEEEIRAVVDEWNALVRRYERKSDRIRAFGIAGIILAAVRGLSSESVAQAVPWLSALAPALMTYVSDSQLRDFALLGHVMDWINGKLASTPPEAVLLSRIQKRAAGMKVRVFRP